VKHQKKSVSVLLVLLFTASFLLNTGFSYRFSSFGTESLSMSATAPSNFPFNDADGHWAEAAIAEMYAKEIISGYEDSTFRPNKPVTFLEAVITLCKLLKYEPTEVDITYNSYLNDYFNIPDWAVGYISVALKHEIVLYSELQKISQQQPLIRQDAAVLAVRALGLAKQAKKKKDTSLPFIDVSQIDEHTKPYIALVCERKVMNGLPDGSFQPASPISRAEMVVLLSRIAQQIPYINSGELAGLITTVNGQDGLVIIEKPDSSIEEFSLPEKFLIYLDDEPSELNRLSAGNHLRVISSKTTGLTVLLAQQVVPDTGAIVEFEPINVYSLPAPVREWVETNKATENYVAGIYDNNLYFLTTRGEKMTGGYTVEITKVSGTVDETGINYRVWVERSDPAKDAFVKQVITYPVAIVRTNFSGQNINSIFFVDEFNQVLAEIPPPANIN